MRALIFAAADITDAAYESGDIDTAMARVAEVVDQQLSAIDHDDTARVWWHTTDVQTCHTLGHNTVTGNDNQL